MTTKSITVERNFHIMNDDRFIMEKISVTKETTKATETTQELIDAARQDIIVNFKVAYPSVYVHLNFDEVIQVNNNYNVPKNIQVEAPYQKAEINGINIDEWEHAPDEKINKGTIEEQIEACTTLDELESFKLIAKMNPKLQAIWETEHDKIHDYLSKI